MKLNKLRETAKAKGVQIGTQRDMYGWSYWLLDADGNDLWAEDNFFTNLTEVEAALKTIDARKVK